MHEEIKKFSIDGIIGDEADVVHNKEEMIHWLETDMREQGYAPVLDIDPHYSLDYDAKSNYFRFDLTVYGAYVGKEEAWQVSGVSNGKTILKYTPPNKSKES